MFFPHRLVFAVKQDFEKYERADHQKEGAESGDKTKELMEKSRLAGRMEELVNRIAGRPNPPPGYENGFDTNWQSFVAKSDTTPAQIEETNKFLEQLAADIHTRDKIEGMADMLEQHPDLSDGARKQLKLHRDAAKKAEGSATKEGDKTAKREYETFVLDQTARLERGKIDLRAFEELAKLPGIQNTLKNFTISLSSESGFSGQLTGMPDAKTFKSLSQRQRTEWLKAAKKELGKTGENESVGAQKNALLADSAVPDTWKDWLKDPQNPKYGVDKNGAKWTTASVAEWITSELPALKLSTGRYENILSQGRATIDKHGIPTCSKAEFQRLSRGERNEYLDGLQKKIGKHDAEFAQKMESAKVSDGAEVKTISSSAAESVQKKEEQTRKKIDDLGQQLKTSTVAKELRKKFTTRREALERKDKEANQADEIANLRSGKKMNGGGGVFDGFFKKMFGGKAANDNFSAANDNQESPEAAAKRKAEKDRLDNEAANQIATETIGDGKDGARDVATEKEIRSLFKLTNAADNDDLANFVKLTAMADPHDPNYAKEMYVLMNDNNKPFKKMFEGGKSGFLADGAGLDNEKSSMANAA